jgi:hypothetical protein
MAMPILFKGTPRIIKSSSRCEGEKPPQAVCVEWEVTCGGRTVFVTEILVGGSAKACWHTNEPPGSVDDILEGCRRRWPLMERRKSDTKPGEGLAP